MFSKKTTGGDFAKQLPAVSMYSNLSDEELEDLHHKLTAKYGAAGLKEEMKKSIIVRKQTPYFRRRRKAKKTQDTIMRNFLPD
jgi:hypothetical protein